MKKSNYGWYSSQASSLFYMSPQFWLGLQMDYELDTRSDIIGGKLESEVKVFDKLAVA